MRLHDGFGKNMIILLYNCLPINIIMSSTNNIMGIVLNKQTYLIW